MLLVSHYIAASAIGGVGVFTRLAIPAGTVVYRYDTRFVKLFAESDIAELPAAMQEFMHRYAYRGAGSCRLTGAVYLVLDNSRFMNHADAPNLVWNELDNSYFAREDIAADTELTCEYDDFTVRGDPYTSFK